MTDTTQTSNTNGENESIEYELDKPTFDIEKKSRPSTVKSRNREEYRDAIKYYHSHDTRDKKNVVVLTDSELIKRKSEAAELNSWLEDKD